MELIKSNIHMNKIMKNEVTTFFVNREERITEANPGISNIISQKEAVTTDNVAVRNNQVVVNGTISYNILYYPEGMDMATGIEGEIPFEEVIKIPGIEEGSDAEVKLVVLSSSVKPIDAMNFIFKAQIMAYITAEKIEDLEAVTGN